MTAPSIVTSTPANGATSVARGVFESPAISPPTPGDYPQIYRASFSVTLTAPSGVDPDSIVIAVKWGQYGPSHLVLGLDQTWKRDWGGTIEVDGDEVTISMSRPYPFHALQGGVDNWVRFDISSAESGTGDSADLSVQFGVASYLPQVTWEDGDPASMPVDCYPVAGSYLAPGESVNFAWFDFAGGGFDYGEIDYVITDLDGVVSTEDGYVGFQDESLAEYNPPFGGTWGSFGTPLSGVITGPWGDWIGSRLGFIFDGRPDLAGPSGSNAPSDRDAMDVAYIPGFPPPAGGVQISHAEVFAVVDEGIGFGAPPGTVDNAHRPRVGVMC